MTAPASNAAVSLLRRMFGLDAQEGEVDAIGLAGGGFFAPDVVHSLFGPTGTKELLVGLPAFEAFVAGCAEALSDRSDEILAVLPIDEQCAFVHARAWRKARASGREIRYEWAMLYRVENGRITCGADMLDTDAQAFWGSVLSA